MAELQLSAEQQAKLDAIAAELRPKFMAVRDLRRRKADWAAEKQRIAGHWAIWDEMHRDPPVFFRLMLETNAGSKPLFYALEEQQILRANEPLKAALEKQSAGDVNLSIQALNVGSPDAINNFGSSIFNQSIQRG